MKRILFFLVFITAKLVAQQYELSIYDYNYWQRAGRSICKDEKTKIYVIFEDDTEELVFQKNANRNHKATHLLTRNFYRKIKKIRFKSYYKRKSLSGCHGDESTIDHYIPIWNGRGCVFNGVCKARDDGHAKSSIYFQYRIKPLVDIVTPKSSFIGLDDNLDIDVTPESKGFDPYVYTWQYQIKDDYPLEKDWKFMERRFQEKSYLNEKASSFLKKEDIGKKIFFRIKRCTDYCKNSWGKVYECSLYTGYISYQIIKSAPHISSLEIKNNTCYDSKDSSLKIKLDRPIAPNEKISYALVDSRGKPHSPLPFGVSIVSKPDGFNKTLDKDNSYTITNLPRDNYKIRILGTINGGKALYTEGKDHIKYFTIKTPDPVAFSIKQTEDVWCRGGTDGTITLEASGGERTKNHQYLIYKEGEKPSNNWQSFTENLTGGFPHFNFVTRHTISGLSAGIYHIKVRDINGCMAKDVRRDTDGNIIGLGDEIIKTIEIKEPQKALTAELAYEKQPKAYGFSDGKIVVKVTGGTPLKNQKYNYNYVWKHEDGTVWNTFSDEIAEGECYVTLNNARVGKYILTVTDANYSNTKAIHKATCVTTFIHQLNQPDPLEVLIKETKPISCNSSNIYNDPFQDGELTAIAKGGVPFEKLIDGKYEYKYIWKKKDDKGIYKEIKEVKGNVLSNIDKGTYALNIEDANGIVLGEYKAKLIEKDSLYTIKDPKLLTVSIIQKQDVYCNDGEDGWAKAIIKGGTPRYFIQWDNGDTTLKTENLAKGINTVKILDSKKCKVIESIQINHPEKPLKVTFPSFATPSTKDASDGFIEALVEGGTSFKDKTYTYYWQNNKGEILNTQTKATVRNDKFYIRLNNIPKGTYYITIKDANYEIAGTKEGCTTIDNQFILYDPIEATVKIHKPISCNQKNEYNNPYSDGALSVTVTGGLPFSTGQPYKYYWKKKKENGIFEDLHQNTPIAIGLSKGIYALNVEDSRGVVIGEYKSLTLLEPKDVLFNFKEPPLLQVKLSATKISCKSGKDGTATVHISGGEAPYQIGWSNQETTSTIKNLISGNYLVFVTDAKGCQATGNITVKQASQLEIQVTQKDPTCFDGEDGAINITASGGVLPYTYSWNTGEQKNFLNNLKAGTYLFTLKDGNGCKLIREIQLKNPEKIEIDLGEDITLCNKQTYWLDGAIKDPKATYKWTSSNGFTSNKPKIQVNKAGTYTITATSSLGCIATDTIKIQYNNVNIDSEFLLSSQAYTNQELIIFNVSSPLGEKSEWILPKEASLVKKEGNAITIQFKKAATYTIGLHSTQGDCHQEKYKQVVIEEKTDLPNVGDTKKPFIEQFTISPNPNSGKFKTTIRLAEASPISLRMFGIHGDFIFKHPKLSTMKEYELLIKKNLSGGVYFIVLETVEETQVKRIIVN